MKAYSFELALRAVIRVGLLIVCDFFAVLTKVQVGNLLVGEVLAMYGVFVAARKTSKEHWDLAGALLWMMRQRRANQGQQMAGISLSPKKASNE